jgi:16S rRNA processing protein RimM
VQLVVARIGRAHGIKGEVTVEVRTDEPELDEYYDHQLMDLDVVTKDGTEVGRISEISHLPSQDLFVVERADGSEVLIPFVEEIVVEIDLKEQRAVIDPPPGLIDDRAEIASSREASGESAGGTVGESSGESSRGEA